MRKKVIEVRTRGHYQDMKIMKITASSLLVYITAHLSHVAECCFPERSRVGVSASEGAWLRQRRTRVHDLNGDGLALAETPNLRLAQGEQVHGRLLAPWTEPFWDVSVTASWSESFVDTPVWLYLKRDDMPTSSDWDKTGIAFVSRRYSRVRLEKASPGVYFVMVEALVNLRNFTLTVSLGSEATSTSTPPSAPTAFNVDFERHGFLVQEEQQVP